ncbi:MAG: hypothetical protein ABIG93_03340 [archaeon]|nr:hypothetical protein [Nanoarchaeota archaeon]
MKEEKVVFVAIHPHNAYGIYDRNEDYARKRDERLSDLGLEHVLLVDQPDVPQEEHKPDIDVAKEKLDLDSAYWKGRVFLTHSGNYASDYESGERLDFQQLSRIIMERFPADKYVFWGAELHRPPTDLSSRDDVVKTIWKQKNNEPYGCVIFYHKTLDLPNKAIDENHCLFFDA